MSNVQYIVIPPTTAYTVVFPYNQFSKGFDSSFYNPMLTDGRAQKEDVDRVLREIEEAHKPLQSSMGCALCCYILGLLASIGAFVPFMIFVGSKTPGLIPVGIFGFIFLFLIVIVIFVKRATTLSKKMRAAAQTVIDKHNNEFSYRGLRWNIPMHYPKWVELWKDYQGQQQMGQPQQPVYTPPVNQQQPYGNYGVQPQYNQQQQFQQHQNFYPQQNNGYVPPGTQV